jgi:hypothetical protein
VAGSKQRVAYVLVVPSTNTVTDTFTLEVIGQVCVFSKVFKTWIAIASPTARTGQTVAKRSAHDVEHRDKQGGRMVVENRF